MRIQGYIHLGVKEHTVLSLTATWPHGKAHDLLRSESVCERKRGQILHIYACVHELPLSTFRLGRIVVYISDTEINEGCLNLFFFSSACQNRSLSAFREILTSNFLGLM